MIVAQAGRAIQTSCVGPPPINCRLHRHDIDQCLNEKRAIHSHAGCYQLCLSSNVCTHNTCLLSFKWSCSGKWLIAAGPCSVNNAYSAAVVKYVPWSQQRPTEVYVESLDLTQAITLSIIPLILDTSRVYQYHSSVSP